MKQSWVTCKGLFIIVLIISIDVTLGVPPTWTINSNLDAGQLTVVDYTKSSTLFLYPNVMSNPGRNYSSTYFNTNNIIPRVILSNIGYAQYLPTNTSTQIGFQLKTNVIIKSGFNCTAITYGVVTFNLRYLYLAIANEQTTYYTDIQYLTFLNSNLSDGNSVQRSEKMYFRNPNNLTNTNYAYKDAQIGAFVMGFRMKSPNSKSHFSINASIQNQTHYSVNMATIETNSLTQLDFSILMFNRAEIMLNYVNYVDILVLNIVGNALVYVTPAIPNDQYIYRNQIGGGIHVQFNLVTTLGYVGYFSQNSSANDSFIVWKNFVHRIRVCPANQSFYEPLQLMCYSICPSGSVLKAGNICNKCHYSCLTCSSSNASASCTQCESIAQRFLASSSCLCSNGFFDNGTTTCQACNTVCLTCDGRSRNGCLSCDSALNRLYNSSTKDCLCAPGNYQNFTCMGCNTQSLGCLTCSYDQGLANFTCLSCDATLFRGLSADNKSCTCMDGYYQSSTACLKCNSIGCLQCSFNTSVSSQICNTCDLANNFIITSNNSCVCTIGYTLLGSNCILSSPSRICGNGVIQSGQQCDDNNINNADGCSSVCQVELYHTCLNNNTNLTYSLCYYSRQIGFTTNLIYKIPGSNSVRLQFEVDAPNCNPQKLKLYLELSNQLKMYDKVRLLFQQRLLQSAWQSILTKSIVYDPSTNLLVIIFDYNQTIDLTKKYIQFTPSNQHDSAFVQYFYSSPTSIAYLSQPYNNLLTSYHSSEQLGKVSTLKILFTILIILFWIFLIVSMIFKKGAIGVECMLVFQFSYFAVLGMKNISQSWSALQLFGKYSYGYNVQIVKRSQVNHLRTLQIQGNLLNTLNVSLILTFICFFFTIVFKIRQIFMAKKSKKGNKNITSDDINLNSDNKVTQICHEQSNKALIYIIDILLSFLFLTVGIFMINLAFTTSITFMGNLIASLLYLAISITSWILLVKNKQADHFKQISFNKILKIRKQDQNKSKKQFLLQHYYLLMFVFITIISLVIAFLRSFGIIIFILIMVGSIIMIIFNIKVKPYKQKLDNFRFVINCVIINICMLLELIATISSTNGTGFQLVIIVLLSFIALIISNAIILALIIRKERKVSIQRDLYTEQMKIMDHSLVRANISIIQSAQRGVTFNKSREMTYDRIFKQNMKDYESSVRKNLLIQDDSKMEEQVNSNLNQLKSYKNKIKNLENDSNYISSSNGGGEVYEMINLQNILDEINNKQYQQAQI